jgi:hypothetical protein
MPKNSFLDNAYLALVFNGTTIPGLAQNLVSGALTNLQVALHTADPTTTAGSGTLNTQNASEAAYTGYARVSVARTTGGWVVTGSSVSPASNINFPAGTGGGGTATYMSVGVGSSGATSILYSGAISPTIAMGSGVTPVIAAGTTITES